MSLLYVPTHWQTVLKAAQSTYPNAFIAGGALRDLFLGRSPKDVDICVGRGFATADVLHRLPCELALDAAPGSCVDCEDPTLVDLSAIRYQGTVFEFLLRDPNPGPRERIAAHDFGITRVAWDFDGWCVHNDFLEDLSKRVFRARSDRTPGSTCRRAHRFSERFQGFAYDLSIFEGDPAMVGPLTGVW